MIIVMMGASGSGKSTVGERLSRDLKWGWVDTGAIFRESKEEWVVEQLKTAQLFDDEMTAGLVLPRLASNENNVMVGFPRNLKQAEILVERGFRPDVVVEILVPVEEIKKRLAVRGREQDTPEVIAERIAMYEETKPQILAYLIGNGTKLVTVDGSGTPDEVYVRAVTEIKEALAK